MRSITLKMVLAFLAIALVSIVLDRAAGTLEYRYGIFPIRIRPLGGKIWLKIWQTTTAKMDPGKACKKRLTDIS